MSRVVLDDHLLRDLLTGEAGLALRRLLRARAPATTNLYYLRLCRSAAAASGGQLTGRLAAAERRTLGQALVALPDEVAVLPLRDLAHPVAVLAQRHGLSILGAEAVAAASALDATLCVATSDDGPRIRAAAAAERVPYRTIEAA